MTAGSLSATNYTFAFVDGEFTVDAVIGGEFTDLNPTPGQGYYPRLQFKKATTNERFVR